MIKFWKKKGTIKVNGNEVPFDGKKRIKFHLLDKEHREYGYDIGEIALAILLGILLFMLLGVVVFGCYNLILSLGWKTPLVAIGGIVVLYIAYRVGAVVLNKMS